MPSSTQFKMRIHLISICLLLHEGLEECTKDEKRERERERKKEREKGREKRKKETQIGRSMRLEEDCIVGQPECKVKRQIEPP